MTRRWSCVIFDLDGTVLDSAPGVIGSVERAYAQSGLVAPDREILRSWLGPPMADSLLGAGLDAETAAVVLAAFRAHYDTIGVLDSAVFEGVDALLLELSELGIPLAIATSKPEDPAVLILEHLRLHDRFVVVRGARPQEDRSSKADVLGAAIAALEAAGTDVAAPVLIGDRHHDVTGARELGVDSIFVAWGYGDATVESEGAVAVAEDVARLRDLILSEVRHS